MDSNNSKTRSALINAIRKRKISHTYSKRANGWWELA
jgi:hypothetical protein